MNGLFDDLLGGDDPEPSPRPGNIQKAISAHSDMPLQMNERDLAALLRIAASTVRVKASEGVFVRVSRGRYDVAQSVGNYVEHLRSIASRIGTTPPGGDGDDLRAEKFRLTKAQADKEETRVARERGELVPAAGVAREWSSILRDLRNALMAVPSRCGASLPHLTATDVARIDGEIRRTLEALGDAD